MELVINDTATSRLVTAERTFQLLSGTWPVGNGRLDQDPDAVLSASCSDAAARRRTIGLVGAARSVNSQSAALLGASFQQPQVSYSSTSHELSDKSVYPYFCRVVPSDAAQAKALAAVVKVYGWSSVAVLATSDSYGAGISNDFLSAVDAAGVDVVSLSTFRSADTGLEIQRALKDIRESNSRIIVANLIASDAQLVLKLAVDAGMLGPKSGYVWIGSDGWTTPALLEPIEGNLVDEADLARIGELLVGSIGVQPYRETEAFASLWAASRARLEAQFGVEAGAWTEINSFTPFAYDAVWTFVHAVQRLKEAGGDPSVGAQLLGAIKGLSFSGTTGPMNISSQCEPASSYEITNANAAGSFVRVTTWTPQSPDSLESASAITFPDGSTIPPTSQFREVVWISYDVKVATVVLLGILTLHAVVLHAYVMANRFDTVMRAASPNLMHLVIFGAIVSYGAVAVLGFGDGIFPECHAPYFMMCVAVNFTFGTLVAREFRIHRVFNNRSLRDRKVLKDRNLYLFVFAFCIYDTLVHIGYWLLSPATFVVKASLAEDYEDIVNCEYDGVWVFVALSVTPKLVLFAYGSVLAWQVRAIDWNFNESRSIAMAIWNVIVVIVVTAGLWYWLREHVEAAYLVLVACVAVTSLSVHGIVIVPRLLNTYARKKRIQESENLTSSMPKLPGSDLGNSISNNTIPLEETVNYRTITCTNCGVKLLSRKYSERRTVGGPSDGLRSRTTSALRVDTAASMDDDGGTELVEESSDEALTPQSVV